jgi:threonine dehydratase
MPLDLTPAQSSANQRPLVESLQSQLHRPSAIRGMPPKALSLPSLSEIESACALVYGAMPATPQYAWPGLQSALGFETWVKHENHTPCGAFKVRGGLVYVPRLIERQPSVKTLVSATRGNHGQSIAFAARRYGLQAVIVVPKGNSVEKNAAMRALGATLIEHGDDFQASREEAARIASQTSNAVMVPSFHHDLVAGVATYWLEFFRATPKLDVVFVPIGMGSGMNACLAVRNTISPDTTVIGVTSTHAQAFCKSFAIGTPLESAATAQLADGMACRAVDNEALNNALAHLEGIVEVSDDEVAAAMRLMFAATHQAGEGAGVASLAGAMKLQSSLKGLRVGVTLCGANVDSDVFARVLANS